MHFKPAILLLFICLLSLKASAQICEGSLGDPVFTFDFGSGSVQKFPTTDYSFVGGSCPNDGQYALSKTETGCHDDTWHRVLKDHTGNDGYMMVVNADAVPGKVFFSKETTIEGTSIGALCENTTYEFSAYILNLIKAGQFGFIQPRVTFTIETLTGEPIGSPYTVDIPETSDPNGWQKYGTYFTTPAGVTAVVIKMVNNAPGGAGNDLLLDDIAFRACGPIVQIGVSGNAAITQLPFCEGNASAFNISAPPSTGFNDVHYQWQQSINGAGWVDIAGATGLLLAQNFPANKPLGTYQYRLGVAGGANISSLNCRVYSNEVTVSVNPYPAQPVFSPIVVCEGDPLPLPLAAGGATYSWQLPDGTIRQENPLVIDHAKPGNSGRYTLTITSDAQCAVTAPVDVTVNPMPQLNPVAAEPSICRGHSTVLSANAGTAVSYNWSPAEGLFDTHAANPLASPQNTTTYTVTVTDENNCTNTASVTVEVYYVPGANAGDDKVIFEGQSVRIGNVNSDGNLTYSWTPADFLDDPHSPTPVASPPYTINYLLQVSSPNQCDVQVDNVLVKVYGKITIPNSFSPNSDGINDLWNIEALITYPESTLSVYNRNGQQVFYSKGYSKPWDGKLNGAALPPGTYYYVIDLKNGTAPLKGWVLIVR